MIICRGANDTNGQLFTSIFRDKLSLKGARTLGVAVTLRPGDFLLFSALIPHCVSSRCRQHDSIMCVSVYFKTAVIGMNNNELSINKPINKLSQILLCTIWIDKGLFDCRG
jgi:hypothetical protein